MPNPQMLNKSLILVLICLMTIFGFCFEIQEKELRETIFQNRDMKFELKTNDLKEKQSLQKDLEQRNFSGSQDFIEYSSKQKIPDNMMTQNPDEMKKSNIHEKRTRLLASCRIDDCKECRIQNSEEVCIKCQSQYVLNEVSKRCQKLHDTQSHSQQNDSTQSHSQQNESQHGQKSNSSTSTNTSESCPKLPHCIACQQRELNSSTNTSKILVCTKCKTDESLNEKYLLIEGRCFEFQNQTEDYQHQKHDNHKGRVKYGQMYFMCQAGCKVCSTKVDYSQCSQCQQGFILNQTSLTCNRCNGQCLTCSQFDLKNCISCYPGSNLQLKDSILTCQKCSDTHCRNCSSMVNICVSCKNDYYLDVNTSTCKSCGLKCRNCSDAKQCVQCVRGYYLILTSQQQNGQKTCIQCVQGCAICLNFTSCSSCYPGFFYNTSSLQCTKCLNNCWSCNSSSTCQKCVFGNYFSSNSTCVQSIQNCAVMNENGTCSKCFMGYSLSQKKNSCTFDSQLASLNGISYSCKQSQFLQNFTCISCKKVVQNCKQCVSELCIQCKSSYFVSSLGQRCQLCSSTLTGCKQCSNSKYCTKCQTGYYMEQDTVGTLSIYYGDCLKCDQNCLTCSQKNTYCTGCSSGYTLSTSRTCVAQNYFQFSILLNYDYEQFGSKVQQFKDVMASFIKDQSISLQTKRKFVRLNKITKGSTLIQGSISATSKQSIKQTLNLFQSQVTSGRQIKNMQIMSASVSSVRNSNENNDQNKSSNDSSANDDSSKTGVVIGSVVGGVVGIIVVTLTVYFCFCKKKLIPSNADQKRTTSTGEDIADFAVNSEQQNMARPDNHEVNDSIPKGYLTNPDQYM